LTLPKGVQKRA